MDQAHEDVVKFSPVIEFLMDSHAEAGWIGCDVDVDGLKGVSPSGGVIESLGTLEMFGAEGCIGGYPSVVMVFLVVFF